LLHAPSGMDGACIKYINESQRFIYIFIIYNDYWQYCDINWPTWIGGQLLDKRIASLAAVGANFPVIVWNFVLKINISLSFSLSLSAGWKIDDVIVYYSLTPLLTNLTNMISPKHFIISNIFRLRTFSISTRSLDLIVCSVLKIVATKRCAGRVH